MSRVVDMTGLRVGRLTVLRRVGTQNRKATWACVCDCGTERVISGSDLRSGNTISCGCFHFERQKAVPRTHGERDSVEYGIWTGMHQRCSNPNVAAFPRYGGRGIRVAPVWDDFEVFLKDVGRRPSQEHSIDRVDNNRGYEPGNVRWATRHEQARNTRRARILTVGGVVKSLREWAEERGIGHSTILHRLRTGWTVEDAIMTPARKLSPSRFVSCFPLGAV